MPHKSDPGKAPVKAFAPGTILSAATGAPVSFDELMADVRTARVVYVGEMHTSARHHEIQLKVIRALHDEGIRLAVGMEMFDRSYQTVLDLWAAGGLDEEAFLRRTHWYANWRFDYGLYRSILDYIRTEQIPLVALNVPFSIPPKIRVGGTEYLTEYEKGYLPGRWTRALPLTGVTLKRCSGSTLSRTCGLRISTWPSASGKMPWRKRRRPISATA